MSSLPQLIPPQTAPFGDVQKDGKLYVDINWYLFLYNIANQIMPFKSGGGVTDFSANLINASDLDAAQTDLSLLSRQSANIAALQSDADAIFPDLSVLTRSLANLAALQSENSILISQSDLPSIKITGDATGIGTGGIIPLTLDTVNTNVGSFGDGTHVSSFTVNGKGLITAASNIAITGAPPNGAAGGDLSGIYPNPTVSKINGVSLGTTTATSGNVLIGSGNAWVTEPISGDATLSSTGVLTLGTVPTGKGGTGTSATFTQGSVVFADASGIYSQDNSRFYWDDTNIRLGIGCVPQRQFHVQFSNSGTPTVFAFENTDTTNSNGCSFSARGTTTGVGGGNFKEFSSIQHFYVDHNAATIESSMRIYTSYNGSINEAVRISGQQNVKFSTSIGINVTPDTNSGTIWSTLGSNGSTAIKIIRATDTSPTGNFIDFKNVASSSLFKVDITGTVVNGIWNGTSIGTSFTDAKLTSVTGTANQIITSSSTGAITLSTPQDIGTGSGPQFASITVSSGNVFRQNLIVDGGCQIAQGTTATISTTAQFGSVDMFACWATGTTVTAGTIQQNTASTIGTAGYSLQASGVTITGASGTVYSRYRMESIDAKWYKNKTCCFSVQVLHNIGSNATYTIVLRKANSVDNFGAVTVISTSSGQTVSTATGTQVIFTNISMGDCSNGIEIEVKALVGAITTKDLEWTEWQLEVAPIVNNVVTTFQIKTFKEELEKVYRHFEKSFPYSTAPAQNTGTNAGAYETVANLAGLGAIERFPTMRYRVEKRADLTPTLYSTNAASGEVYDVTAGAACTGTSITTHCSSGFDINTAAPITLGVGDRLAVHWIADCRL